MRWRSHIYHTLFVASLMMSLDAHFNGADRRACNDMTPLHDSRPRDQPSPFYIMLSNTTYSPGIPLTVTLAANRGDFFKGFLIQARYVDDDVAVGSFTPAEGTKTMCDWRVGLTHSSDNLKSKVTFEWNPPSILRGKILFKTTFVESQYSYWVSQESAILNEGATTTTTPTTTTTETSETSETTTSLTTTIIPEITKRQNAPTTSTPRLISETGSTTVESVDKSSLMTSSHILILIGLVIIRLITNYIHL